MLGEPFMFQKRSGNKSFLYFMSNDYHDFFDFFLSHGTEIYCGELFSVSLFPGIEKV